MNIFVSYTTRDKIINRQLLEDASEVLSTYGNFYIDLLHNDSLDKQAHVRHMLSQSNLLVLIESCSIKESSWVQWELREAERIGIPVLYVPAMSNQKEIIKNIRFTLDSEFDKLTRRSSNDALMHAT
ncbi:hypothetical protein [Shewanella sp. 0m-4]